MKRPIRIELVNEGDTKSVRLEIDQYLMHLGSEDVGMLIEQLGAFRAAISPAVPGRVSRKHKYSIEVDPFWYAEPHPTSDAIVVFLRDTGKGWIGFAIPREKAVEFCEELSLYANVPVKTVGLAN